MKQDDVREDWEKAFAKKFNYTSFTWNGDNFSGVTEAKKTRNKVKSFIRSLLSSHSTSLLQKMEQVIGEDDPKPIPDDLYVLSVPYIRNELRAKQRSRLIEAVKG